MYGDLPAFSDQHNRVVESIHSQFQGMWPEILLQLNRCLHVINAFHLEKVNDLDPFVSTYSFGGFIGNEFIDRKPSAEV